MMDHPVIGSPVRASVTLVMPPHFRVFPKAPMKRVSRIDSHLDLTQNYDCCWLSYPVIVHTLESSEGCFGW